MVVTRVYRPSDVKALEKVRELKRKLGVPDDPSKWSEKDRMKVANYFRSIGWDMAMMGCNPEVFGGADPNKKALCILYNELNIARNVSAIHQIEKEKARLPPQFRKQIVRQKEEAKKRIGKLEKWNRVVKEVEQNTGIKTVPKAVTNPVLHPDRPPAIVKATGIHVGEPKLPENPIRRKSVDMRKVGLGLLGLAVLYYVMRRR